MRIRVETCIGHGGVEWPCRLHFDERCIEVAESLDQWHGADYRYFKVKGGDGNLYLLRVNDSRNEWDLTLFQSGEVAEMPAAPPTAKHRPPPS